MADFLKLLLPVFLSPVNYAEMLKKLSSFLFYEIWIATFALRQIPSIGVFFQWLERLPPIKSIASFIPGHEKLNLTGLLIGLAVAGVSYAIQLHDRISDLFGIRYRFDTRHILFPLARATGKRLTDRLESAICDNRDTLMRAVFYKFASSRAAHTIVDKHDIERALDGWSWFWILIEAMPVMLISGIVALSFGAKTQGLVFFTIFAVLLIAAWLFHRRLIRLSRPQVEAIVADPKAHAAVKKEFNAL